MTRFQLPDTPEDLRRTKRSPIVIALFVAALFIAAMFQNPSFRSVLGETLSSAPLHAGPVVARIVPDQIPLPLPPISPDALDVRACAGNPECDPRYYEPGVF